MVDKTIFVNYLGLVINEVLTGQITFKAFYFISKFFDPSLWILLYFYLVDSKFQYGIK